MEEAVAIETCTYCGSEQNLNFVFCSNCGKRNGNKDKTEHKKFTSLDKNIQFLAWYSIVTISFVIFGALTEDTFEILLALSIILAIIDIGFAAAQPNVWKLYKPRNIKVLPLLSIIGICITTGFVVSYSMDYLNSKLFEETTDILRLFDGMDHPLLYSIILIAVFPAFFEELAYRGFVYNSLDKINGVKSAIWGSTFLFAISHISLLSIIWIIPFGLMLAYFRSKYSNLYYGMVGHFTHNTTIILIEYYIVQGNAFQL